MRVWLLLSLLGCACSDVVSSQSSAIAYGTSDSAHTAVVALLGSDGNGFTECTGTMVQSKNGHMYVLTAAHCCNAAAPRIVVASNDYSVGVQYVTSGTPQPPSYAVTTASVWSDAKYNTTDHDFCMLQFAATNLPTIALPSANDGLALSTAIETVGFGVTETNANNSARRHGSSTIDLSLTADLIEASQGGTSHVPGACEGDSGGPILVAAGAAQASQFLVGVVSYQNGTTCAQSTQSFASRVSSELGTGGFITSYLADTPIGTHVGFPTDAGIDATAPDATTPDATTDAAPVIDSSTDAPADAPVADTSTGSEPAQTSSGGCNASNAPASGTAAFVSLFALVLARALRRHRVT